MLKIIENKVIASAAGSGVGAALSGFALWLLGVLVWHASASADKATVAVAAVPEPVAGLVGIVLVVAASFVAGYQAPHTSRTIPTAPVDAIAEAQAIFPQS